MQLTNKTVLVTGATGGIGSLLCRRLAERGARLILTCIDEGRLRNLQTELGPLHQCIAADIGSFEGRNAIAALCGDAGGVDAMVNLAGILDFNLFQNQGEKIVAAMLHINTVAPILLTRLLLPQLLARDEARIVNVGSIFGSIGHPGFAVYCASKAAMKSFSEALARELGDTPVSVGYVAPRATRTALNNDHVRGLNQALGTKEDPPSLVAEEICAMLESKQRQRFLGWPEKLFVFINAVLPSVVHKALVGKLPLVRKFAQSNQTARIPL